MLSNKSFGIAGAAMLGTVALMGTNAANAAINLDDTAENEMKAAVTFAMETVTEEVKSDLAGTYYKVAGRAEAATVRDVSVLDVVSKVGVGAAQGETLVVTYELSGMVFGEALVSTYLGLRSTATAEDNQLGTGEVVLVTGGGSGESTATFHVSELTASSN